jgi:hypothetical protein
MFSVSANAGAQKIKDNAAWHSNLHAILAETAGASSAMDQQKQLIADVEGSIARATRRIQECEQKREKEFREHKDYRDSHFKKLAYKVGGQKDKFEARQSKEEEEYHESLREVQQAEREKSELDSVHASAIQRRAEIEQDLQRKQQAQHDLDRLYSDIFDPAGPEFPIASEALDRYVKAMREHDTASDELRRETHVVNCLTDSRKLLERARRSVEDALRWSRVDIIGGGTLSDLKERSALEDAAREIQAAFKVFDAAQQARPRLPSLPKVNIPTGNLLSDVFFDNVFTDLHFHDKIKQAGVELARCIFTIEDLLNKTRNTQTQLQNSWSAKIRDMKHARSELQNVRKMVFESVIHDEPAPEYPSGPEHGKSAPAPAGEATSHGQLANNNPFRTESPQLPSEQPPPYQT